MTIREVKACNSVNVNVSIYLLIVFLFPQNLQFLNTFVVFLIMPIRFDLPRCGDSCIYNNETIVNSLEDLEICKFKCGNI